MATKFQYLHVNSSMRSKSGSNGEDAKLEINMSGHEIKDVKSVAVKQFTINNSSFNITSHKDTLKFAIVRKKLMVQLITNNLLLKFQMVTIKALILLETRRKDLHQLLTL